MCLEDNNKEFMDFWEEMEQQFKEDSLTEEQRTQMIEDFKKNDIHLIIGETAYGEQEAQVDYKQCIDWPAASKEDMLLAEIDQQIALHGEFKNPEPGTLDWAVLRELGKSDI